MAAIDTDTRGSVNVDLNVVPFIDLMSCLTAFLLVTAVWSNLAQINVKAKANAGEQDTQDEWVRQSLLISDQEVLVGLSRVNEITSIPRAGGDYDWAAVGKILVRNRAMVAADVDNPFVSHVDIGAEDDISYQDLIAAMDTARAVGLQSIGVVAPEELPTRFAR